MNNRPNYYTLQLPNGFQALHLPYASAVAYCGVMIKAGTVDEEVHEHGLAHFLEHVLFKGTEKRTTLQVINRLERVGGDVNAYTNKEYTFLYATFLREHFQRAAELLGDMLFHSVFPAKELEKEKDVVIDEIESYQDTPEEAIYDEFEEKAFARQSIGRNILGTQASVRAFTPELVQGFVDKHYHPGNMVLISVGDVPEKQWRTYMEWYFAEPKPTTPRQDVRADTRYTRFRERLQRDTHQAHVILGASAYAYNHHRRRVFSLINSLLGGGGMTSRLNLSLREKHGYSYQVDSNYAPYTGTGLFSVYFGTDRSRIEKSLDLVYKELRRLKQTYLGKQQLQDAKNQMQGQMLISAENKENLLAVMARRYMQRGELYSVQRELNEIQKITAEQALQVANELFQEKNLSTLIYE